MGWQKEKENSERRFFSQEPNPWTLSFLANWMGSPGCLEGLRTIPSLVLGQTRGGICAVTLWLGGPVLLGICLSLSRVWVGQMWQSGCLWVSRQRELLERQRESPLELSSYEYVVHHNECIPTSPSPSSTCIMKFCPSSLYRYLYLSISLHACHHPSPGGLHLPPVSAAVARQCPQAEDLENSVSLAGLQVSSGVGQGI